MSEHHQAQLAGAVPQPPIAAMAGQPSAQWRAGDTPPPPSERIRTVEAEPPDAAPPRWPRVFPGL